MTRSSAQSLKTNASAVPQQVLLVIGASLLVALCARVTLPLPFTPVPLTLQNFGVLLVGLALGSRRGFTAMALYLAEGGAGLPVFSQGLGGMAHLFGPTGGYLMAYPLVAFIAGLIAERGTRSFGRVLIAGIAGEVVLFVSGVIWLAAIVRVPLAQAASFGLYPFVFAEVMKITAAATAVHRWQLRPRNH